MTQGDDSLSGYRGMDKDEIFNREGLTPQQYLEFTERFIPENETTTHNETVKNSSKKCHSISTYFLYFLKSLFTDRL